MSSLIFSEGCLSIMPNVRVLPMVALLQQNLINKTKLNIMKNSNDETFNAIIGNSVLSAVHSEQREIDVQKLCKAILETPPNCWDNPNGAYETSCPFCYTEELRGGGKDSIWATMGELQHESDCAYLIAKDLSTNCR